MLWLFKQSLFILSYCSQTALMKGVVITVKQIQGNCAPITPFGPLPIQTPFLRRFCLSVVMMMNGPLCLEQDWSSCTFVWDWIWARISRVIIYPFGWVPSSIVWWLAVSTPTDRCVDQFCLKFLNSGWPLIFYSLDTLLDPYDSPWRLQLSHWIAFLLTVRDTHDQ